MPLRVGRSLTIPDEELRLSFTTSGGPGGQHANRSATRAILAWNVANSGALGPRQRARILKRLGNRIDSRGELKIASDRYRSQLRNREDVMKRLEMLVGAALKPRKRRVATGPTRASVERRLRDKKQRAETKARRRTSGRELEGDR
jgi:ribosome-associated protein